MNKIYKLIFLSTLTFAIPIYSSYSQVSGKVVYKSILESEDFIDLESVLLFDELESYFFVQIELENSDKNFEEPIFLDDKNVQFEFDFTPKRNTRYEVYINRGTQTISSQSSYFKNGEVIPCVVIEESGSIDWVIDNQFKKIGSFNTQRASAKFRGRNYIAWFAPEIPIPIGPWKFNGLPGLILEVQDEELGVQFLFSSIELPFDTNNGIKKPSDGNKISAEEYFKHNQSFAEEFIKLIKAKLPRDVTISDISVNRVVKSIEREY